MFGDVSAFEGLEVLALSENYREIAAKSFGVVLFFSVEHSLSNDLFARLVQHLKRTNYIIGIRLRVHSGTQEGFFGVWIEKDQSLIERAKYLYTEFCSCLNIIGL